MLRTTHQYQDMPKPTNGNLQSRYRTRLAGLIAEAIRRIDLDLTGLRVLTAAATGPSVVTPNIAALGGADVTAYTKDSRHGTVAEVYRETVQLAQEMGAESKITVVRLQSGGLKVGELMCKNGKVAKTEPRYAGLAHPL